MNRLRSHQSHQSHQSSRLRLQPVAVSAEMQGPNAAPTAWRPPGARLLLAETVSPGGTAAGVSRPLQDACYHETGAASLNGQARLTLLLWTRIEQPAQQPAAVTLEEGSTNIVSWLHGPGSANCRSLGAGRVSPALASARVRWFCSATMLRVPQSTRRGSAVSFRETARLSAKGQPIEADAGLPQLVRSERLGADRRDARIHTEGALGGRHIFDAPDESQRQRRCLTTGSLPSSSGTDGVEIGAVLGWGAHRSWCLYCEATTGVSRPSRQLTCRRVWPRMERRICRVWVSW
jgi:hypothetical protein